MYAYNICTYKICKCVCVLKSFIIYYLLFLNKGFLLLLSLLFICTQTNTHTQLCTACISILLLCVNVCEFVCVCVCVCKRVCISNKSST